MSLRDLGYSVLRLQVVMTNERELSSNIGAGIILKDETHIDRVEVGHRQETLRPPEDCTEKGDVNLLWHIQVLCADFQGRAVMLLSCCRFSRWTDV